MAYLTLSEYIERAPAEVFAYLMDFSLAARWRRRVERIELVGGGTLGVGATMRVVYRISGETQERNFTITEYDPPRRMAWRRDVSSHEWVVRYDVEPEGNGSRVTLTIEAAACAWRDRLKLWLYRGAQRREMADQLPALRRAMVGAPIQESRS